jgi:putative transposase
MPWKKNGPMDQRIEFALKALRTDNFRALCQEYEISTKTGYKWQKRLLRWGWAGMAEQSRRPRSHADQLGESVICEIVRLKQAHPFWGPRKLRELYLRRHGTAASESSFKRILERAGLTERRRRRRAEQAGRLWSGRRAQTPNEVWTVDFKGWWYDRQRMICQPLTVRDEHSRYILELRRVADARTETVRACFEGLFERHGLPEAIRSDNGTPFAQVQGLLGLSRLSAWWVALGIDLERGRPGHPQDNGGHERMHRDIGRELEPAGIAEQAALDLWRQEFNQKRPHEALGMKCPAEVYQSSRRHYEGSPEDLDYPGMEARRVSPAGMIKWHGIALFISASLVGWSVGLKPRSDGSREVWFGRLLLGWIDNKSESFQRATGEGPLEAGQQ